MGINKSLSGAMLVVLAISMALGACSPTAEPSGGQSGTEDDTLNLAFFADISTADPDVFYDIEGLAITQSVYEGLVKYGPDSTELEPALATSWDVSNDGLTYTFQLQDGVTFSDGTQFDSSALKTSFKRRSAVAGGPSYMLADVDHYETPDPQTFVVVLEKPVSSFLDLMASAWGPKAISPKVLEERAGDDHAQKYLMNRAVGTGPYVLTSFQRGTGYTLEANPDYWSEKPFFKTVEIEITPDISAQTLKLRSGDLDAILHGFPISNLPTVENNDDLMVENFDSLGTTSLYLNTHKPALSGEDVREAVIKAMDVPSLVADVYGDTASIPEGAYPKGLLDPSLAPIDLSYEPEDAKSILEGQDITLDVVYTPDSSGVQRRLADLIRQKLAMVGITAKPRQAQLGEVFAYREDVESAADIYVSTPTPDGAHPDTWGRIVWYTEAGLNFFNYSNSQLDAALDRGLRETSEDEAAEFYGAAGEMAYADWAVVPIAHVNDVVVHRSDLENVQHVPAYPWTLSLASLRR